MVGQGREAGVELICVCASGGHCRAPPPGRRKRAATLPAGPRLPARRRVRPGRPVRADIREGGSVPSLAAGLLFGGLAGLGSYQLSQDPKNVWLFLVTSGTLAGIMGMRFYNSRKFMPAGLIAGASLLMVVKLGISALGKPHQ
uniref:Transmembrane protein 14C n=1 Tax=Capra hircus TaxID=9925 RepID=A0A8C2RS22_CAPHI